MKKLSYILASIMYLAGAVYYGLALKGLIFTGEQTSNAQLIENLKLLLSNKVFLLTFPLFLLLTVILISTIVSLIIQNTATISPTTAGINTEERIKLIEIKFNYFLGFLAIVFVFILLLRIGSCMAKFPAETLNTPAVDHSSE